MRAPFALAALLIAFPLQAQESAFKPLVDKAITAEVGDLEKLYLHLHAHPEIAFQEVETSARLASELKKLGFEVTTKVGTTGVVGVFKNGPGPTILVRTDMDALPVTEKTGLPYASKVRIRDKEGRDVGVMHACGHDIHMTCWVGAARVLTQLKDSWKGTLVFIGQPAEEIGSGARRMLEDGLYTRFPRPDFCLGLHASPLTPAGLITYSEGLMMANVDTVDILVRGKGGHGAAPHLTIDPIVLAARIVIDLQTLRSREIDPIEGAVVTVGAIRGGTKHNVIPSEVLLQLTVRSFKDSVRKHLLEGIERISKAAAMSARAPEPTVTVSETEFTPALYNNPELTKKVTGVFRSNFGDANVKAMPPIMGGEDFARYAKDGTPIFFWFLGTMDQKRWTESKKEGAAPLPSMHSEFYYPAPEPSIRHGVASMSLAVLDLLKK
ncbi:MAG: amidohydrolase [Planctomycetota bacterium]|jgi:amidohydrolase